MGKFFSAGETVRLIFPDGQWVDLKKEPSQGDADYVAGKMFADGKANILAGRLPMMARLIIAWSFEEDGKPVPVSEEMIDVLDSKYRNLIIEKINQLTNAADEWPKN